MRHPSPRYGTFPTTADVGVWATAGSPGELFAALGRALFSLTTDLRKVRPLEERAIAASAGDPAALAVAFLGELIVLHDAENFLAREMEVKLVGSPPTAALATVRGERFDPSRHSQKIQVKAATLHDLEVDLVHGRARVIVDI
ncbi:MAG TPA: archease [Thermoplasmata archaeon]|nr:archease [Thermoplasmata archaeon]